MLTRRAIQAARPLMRVARPLPASATGLRIGNVQSRLSSDSSKSPTVRSSSRHAIAPFRAPASLHHLGTRRASIQLTISYFTVFLLQDLRPTDRKGPPGRHAHVPDDLPGVGEARDRGGEGGAQRFVRPPFRRPLRWREAYGLAG